MRNALSRMWEISFHRWGKERWSLSTSIAGVAILVAHQLSACTLRLTSVDERVASLHLWVKGGDPNCSQSHRGGSLIQVTLMLRPGGRGGMIGKNAPPDLKQNGVLLLDFCARLILSTSTTFRHKDV